ncbi:tail fiber assembly protein [Franconibacter daqui]|uniref:tail fiber assembly protein n=1 Tax=Franconibacter daqui TaxID=2047724 RepID=UPI0030D4D6BE
MLTLNKFKQYTPEFMDLMNFRAIFLESEDGLDWYFHMSRFQADTLKVCFDENNIIRSFSYEADRLFPSGLSVTEVAAEKVPEGLNIHGGWILYNGEIIPAPVDYVALAEKQRDSEMTVATERINALAAAQEDDDITDEEEKTLAALRIYRSALRRLDVSTAPDIDWPKKPMLKI